MNKRFKTTATIAMLTTAWTSFGTSSIAAPPFTDLSQAGIWAQNAIVNVYDTGVMQGADGQFRPLDAITRREAAVVIAKAMKLDVQSVATASFSDLSSADWGHAQVEAMSKAALIKGDEQGKFRPNDLITREELAAIFVRALGVDATGYGSKLSVADQDSISSWARESVGYSIEVGLMQGDGTHFYPKRTAQRQEMAVLVSKLHDIQTTKPVEQAPPQTPTTPPPTKPTPPSKTKPQGTVKVAGKIIGEGGTQGIANATVLIYNQEGFREEVKTDANGEYNFTTLKKHGKYSIHVQPAEEEINFLPRDPFQPVSITYAGSKMTVDNIALPKVMVTSKVLTPDGKPVVGATVYVYSLTINDGYRAERKTDATGAYRLGGLQIGKKYIVQVVVPAGMEYAAPKRKEFIYYSPESVPEMKVADVQLKGKIVTPDGSVPQDWMSVELIGPGNDRQSTSTDSKGEYRFGNLTSGLSYTIKISRPANDKRFDAPREQTIRFEGSQVVAPTATLQEANVVGTVYKTAAKTPEDIIRYTQVRIKRVGDQWSTQWVDTDQNGQFRFHLTDGTYEIVATSRVTGYADAKQRIVVINGVLDAEPDLVFAKPLLQGFVKDKQGNPLSYSVTLKMPGDVPVESWINGHTNEEGAFAFADVPDGTYTLEVSNHYITNLSDPKYKDLPRSKSITVVVKDQVPQMLADIVL